MLMKKKKKNQGLKKKSYFQRRKNYSIYLITDYIRNERHRYFFSFLRLLLMKAPEVFCTLLQRKKKLINEKINIHKKIRVLIAENERLIEFLKHIYL